jgi:xylulokinase
MQKDQVELHSILALSGSAQQHGSVYLNHLYKKAFKTLDFKEAFSRNSAPIWMDSSTSAECKEIKEAFGGKEAIIRSTGSDAFERFSAAQIRKFYKQEPIKYAETKTIALISSFLASIMTGELAPIDHGDGSGMNLMNIHTKTWDPKALLATAPHLREKIPPLVPSTTVLGKVNPYFQQYGLNPEALSLAWTGDNPSSLIGLGLIHEGMGAVSLGTSFTHFGCIKTCHIDPKGEGHLFVSPTGDYMTLNCFLNGALAIQKMREFYKLDWAQFNHHLQTTPAGNEGKLLLPYFDAEIVPKILKPSLHRQHLKEDDIPGNCRALIEAQMMSMKLHSSWMNLQTKCIYATGGVSHNLPILQILSDVFNANVFSIEVSKSTALGAALKAAFGYFGNKAWSEILEGFTNPSPAVNPNQAAVKVYEQLLPRYQALENSYKT